jgi:hypothetical protein
MVLSRYLALALAVVCVAPVASAQSGSLNVSGATPLIVVSDTLTGPGQGIHNPLYAVANTQHTGIANLWMRNSTGAVSNACTGNLLWTGRHILTAAHCLAANYSTLEYAAGTHRFRTATGGWMDYHVDYQLNSTVFIAPGYTGDISVRDLAIIDLGQEVDLSFERYTVASESPIAQRVRLQGYGCTGNGFTGDIDCRPDNPQLTDAAVLRQTWNRFDTTCTDDLASNPFIYVQCARRNHPNPDTFGGFLMLDHDYPGFPEESDLCFSLRFCDDDAPYPDEGTVGKGDSGSAAFLESSNTMVGVASWAFGFNRVVGDFLRVAAFTCVANYAPNSACTANYQWITSIVGQPGTVVPEPASHHMLAAGLLVLAGVARARRGSRRV